jgi:TonB-linked SusC/RagA family outer membrane protein
MTNRGNTWLWLALPAFVAAPRAARAQQQVGTITGRITEVATGQPVAAAQVQVVGTNVGTVANDQGRFTLRNVPARAVTVRVLRVGFAEQTRAVTVAAGGTTTADITLRTATVVLTPVVTTATGQTRRVELGNSISTISAAEVVQTSPASNLGDVLNARAPGVTVISGTQAGTGSRIRIRGNNSLSLNNEPIWVIDGVRMTSDRASGFSTGGNRPSRVTDLNPEEVENIEIVKGPSAATLYGTDAANGVVVVTTKKGRAGRAQWTAYGEGGLIADLNTYPLNYTIAGRSPGSTAYRECGLPLVSAGTCVLDSVRTYSPLRDDDATPLGTGNRRQFGLQVSGGTEAVRYFLSGEREDETGLLEIPAFERRQFDSLGTTIHPWTARPNRLGKNSFRANLNAAVTPRLDVGVNAGYVNSEARFSLESNATAGLGSHAFGGPGYRTNGTVSELGTPLNGYRAWTPGLTWQERTGQDVDRFIGSATVQYRPSTWLSARANVGSDLSARVDDNLLMRGEGPPLTAVYRRGFKRNGRTNIRNVTADLAATATVNPRLWLNSRTTVGAQYINYRFDQNEARGDELPPGAQTAGAGAIPITAEATTIQRTLGLYVEEAVALRDRLFLTAAVRTDQNSAFGSNFQSVFYPKASVSWLLSDEPGFPKPGALTSLRLRAAYGASGVQPGPNDAIRSFGGATVNLRATDLPGIVFDSVGNTDLRPERTAEIETGFEARFFGGRAGLDLTYYNKTTRDALVSAIVSPSLGAAERVRRNLGSVKNAGWEALLDAKLVDRRWAGVDVTLNGSLNNNRLVSLGGTAPQIGTTTRAVEGYPLFGLWAQPITGWDDKNGDRILTYNADPALNEVFVGDSAIFRGYSAPRYQAALTTGVELFSRRLRLQTLLDYRGGNRYYNNTERIRCVSRQNCNGLMNPAASFEEQAMVVATRDHPSKTLDGFFQPGSFVRLREATVSYRLPETLVSRVGRARSLTLTATARNLVRWTNYRGADPETDFQASEATQGANVPQDFQTVAPPSYFVLRVNVGF